MKAIDPDEGQLLYEMGWKASVDSSLREIFQVRTDGSIILVQQLDYEREKQYVIPVRVRDKVHSAQAEVRVIVEDTNDNSPFYTLNPAVLTIMEESKSREPIGEVSTKLLRENDRGNECESCSNTALTRYYIAKKSQLLKMSKCPNDNSCPVCHSYCAQKLDLLPLMRQVCVCACVLIELCLKGGEYWTIVPEIQKITHW